MFDPRLLVGYDSSDDACVYSVSDDVAVIETVDFFTPIVDDPYEFGRIAAANALSDVFAMGAKPLVALNLLALDEELGTAVAAAILQGGADAVREAGALVGGAILPGPQCSLASLVKNTAQLPQVELEATPRRLLGTNTAD